ncbi:intercellular trafficking and secretion [Exophiala sideris]|uniref:Sorting nexin-4 n=1 Tax=Exophiala sideris TaxID=1016849 RepID=A0ABR0IY06_9EURO|nr:intercellular trafficking and secretion [Exophiala sideris]KAK5025072.1 intercellular trafficking and secretion [Exophiala sideris]KAK5051166.1 intercellular trafficking and secretion [Exophiala sideris]KAK5176831.1 intercellular trafficking and secretion [Eurotiomycetes sp. CCFEE 6388]
MDDHGDFDSVSWQREDAPAEAPAAFQANLPDRPASGRRSESMTSEPQAGEDADAVDLAGIGREGTLEVTVDQPLKENDGTKDAYVSYLVTTNTDFKTFQKSDFSVRRRFTDFVFLRQALHRDYQACAIPPLPEKNNMAYVRGDRFSTEFTQRRAWSLHRFLKRCTLHPVLRRAPILILFLETADWNAQMRNRPSRSNTIEAAANAAAPTGFFDNVADTMLNAFSKVHKPDKRFIEVTERANKLDEDLVHVEKIIARVARREGDLEADYADLASNMRKLTPLEPAIEAQLQTFAGCVEETSRGWKGVKDHTDQNYLGSLRDMEAYINSVKALLKTREQKQLDFEGLTEYLQKATAERDSLASNNPYSHGSNLNPATFIRNKVEDMRGVDHDTARRERARKLELRIAELNREVDSAKGTSEMFDEQVVREVADFERIKGLEFRDSMGALAVQHIDFYQGVISTWERFLIDMDADNKDKGRAT